MTDTDLPLGTTGDVSMALEIRNQEGATMFAVTQGGQVFWNGREIQGDEDFAKSFATFGEFVAGVAHGDIFRILGTLSDSQRLEIRSMISETGSLVVE